MDRGKVRTGVSPDRLKRVGGAARFEAAGSAGQARQRNSRLLKGVGSAAVAVVWGGVAWGQQEAEPAPPYQPQPAAPTPDLSGKLIGEWPHLTGDWWGARHAIESRGVIFRANETFDLAQNSVGGVNTGSLDTGQLFTFSITVDTERLLGLHGGTFFTDYLLETGRFANADVGAAQNVDRNDVSGTHELAEMWYQQVFGRGDAFQLKGGKMDANNDFAYALGASEFLNASFGNSQNILDFPTYPNAALGANFFYLPKTGIYAGAGVYDGGLQEGLNTGETGPATALRGRPDLFLMQEVGAKWAGKFAGRFGVGAWEGTGRFERFEGTTEHGAEGVYAVADQTVWQPASGNGGVAVFLMYGYADPAVSALEHHLGAGATWTGMLPGRGDDVAGVGVSSVVFSDARSAGFTRDTETVVEGFYKVAVTPFLSVKPDVEYVHDPGGVGGRGDAVVVTVRVGVDF